MITDYNDFVAAGFQLVALSLSLSLSLMSHACCMEHNAQHNMQGYNISSV
jgi:hypothetical protein